MRLLALLLTLVLAAAAFCLPAESQSAAAGHYYDAVTPLPNAPQPQPYVAVTAATSPTSHRPAGFFTFRKSFRDPPLRTNKQVFTSKTFLIFHGMLLASLAVDNWHTHGAREHWDSEGPAIAGVTAMDYVMDRFFTRAYSIEGPIYGIQHYVRDALGLIVQNKSKQVQTISRMKPK